MQKYQSSLLIALLILVPLMVFWETIDHDFVWDDELSHLHRNPYLKEFKLENFLHFWQSPYEGMYIPISYNAWAGVKCVQDFCVDVRGQGGFDPRFFHGANLLCHIANGLLVFAILNILISLPWAAWAGALLFLLHPLQVETVAWISEFRGLLSTFFALLALWLYLKRRLLSNKTKESMFSWSYGGASLAFILSLLAKPSTVILPLLVFLIVCFFYKDPLRRHLGPLLLWLGLAGITLLITKISQPNRLLDFIPPFYLRPFIVFDAINFYLAKLFYPVNLCACYGRTPQVTVDSPYFFFSWIPLSAILILLWYTYPRSKKILFCFAIFTAGFLPVSGIVPFAFQNFSTVADRYLYLAMIGPAILFAVMIREFESKKITQIGAIVLLLFLALSSRQQMTPWENKITLWANVIEKYPGQAASHNNMGNALAGTGKNAEALIHYEKALEILPEYYYAYNSAANSLVAEGNTRKAKEYYSLAIKLNPGYMEAHNNLGHLLEREGQIVWAKKHYIEALKTDPYCAEAHTNLGNVLVKQREFDQAIHHYSQAVKINPYLALAYYNMGGAFLKKEQFSEAAIAYTKAAEIEPNDDDLWNNLGFAFFRQGQYSLAIEAYQRAVAIHPQSARNHRNLADAWQKQNNILKAIHHYSLSLKWEPNHEVTIKKLSALQGQK